MTVLTKIASRAVCAAFALAMALCLALCLAFAGLAWADTAVSPIKVSDDVTHFSMVKLDKASHDYIEGAQMAIIEKDTNEVVAEWTTGKEAFNLEKVLNVDTMYILREMAAPAGYAPAPDTEFYVNSSETEGITLVSEHENVELIAEYTLALYDESVPSEEWLEEIRHNEQVDSTTKTTAPKTGDETPIAPVVVGGFVLLAVAAALQLVKRRRTRGEHSAK